MLMRQFTKSIVMRNPLTARKAIGRAQLHRLEEEFRTLLADPYLSGRAQIVFGWLESILEVGVSQPLWDRSFERAIAELESIRNEQSGYPKLIVQMD